MTTTRYPNGLTTAPHASAFDTFILPDETRAHYYFNDFNFYRASDWTVTTPFSSVPAVIDGDGGILSLNSGPVATATPVLQSVKELFSAKANKQLWFKTSVRLSNLNSIIIIGLQPTNTTVTTTTTGIYFEKLVSDNDSIRLHLFEGGLPGNFVDLAVSDFTEQNSFGFYFDGLQTYKAYVNDELLFKFISPLEAPGTELKTTMAFENNGQSATLEVDYILAAQER